MAARRGKLNLGGVPGLSSSGGKLDFIHGKANSLAQRKKEADATGFHSRYVFDEPRKVLGEGAHAAVYKCYKKEDIERKEPFAVKVAREPDEERRLAH